MTLKVMRAEQSAKAKDKIAELAIPQNLHDILRANDSIALPNVQLIEDSFMHQGPNGAHLYFVSQFAGPSVYSILDCPGRVSGSRRLRSDLARKVARQVATAVQLIHSADHVHGGSSSVCVSSKCLQLICLFRSHNIQHPLPGLRPFHQLSSTICFCESLNGGE